MLRSRLVALLRSSELHPCSFSNVCDHRKEDLKHFDVCRSDNKCIVTDEQDEHGLRKLSLLVFRTEHPSNDAISDPQD
jgi:predicted nuclease of predicted toxin-antitoxin system